MSDTDISEWQLMSREFVQNSKYLTLQDSHRSTLMLWALNNDFDQAIIIIILDKNACLRCQGENKQDDCVVIWGECNHSFHNCCMSLWVKQNNRCPLCQQEWSVQRVGK
ncbi:unnamed protein product, partial [Meganyctiphanes norvegica]